MSILVKYTKGEVKESIKSCVYLPDYFAGAKELHDKKFSSSFRIAAEYRKRFLAWPKVKASDAASLNKFETFFSKYQSSLAGVSHSTDNSQELLQLFQNNLPVYFQDRLNQTAFKVGLKFEREPGIEDFVQLINKEKVLLDDPLYSREAISNFSRHSDDKQDKQNVKSNATKFDKCICCSKVSNDLENCQKYSKMNFADRRRLIFRKQFCFCCLKPTNSSHSGKTCKNERT